MRFSACVLPLALAACADSAGTSAADARPADDASARDAGEGLLDAQAALDAMIAGLDAALVSPDAASGCAYPSGAVEPMAMDRVLTPYRWDTAIDGAGARAPLDLAAAHCDADAARSWAPYDVILFVSMPAW